MKDLEALEKELDDQDYKDAEAEKARKEIKTRNIATGAGSRLGAKKPRKNANYTIKSEGAANYTEIAPETSKPKPRGQQKKPTKKKINVVESDDEDEQVLALKDRLAAYNHDSSPDHTAMGTEVMTNKEPSKRAVISKKVPSPTYTELYDDDDGDDHMEAEVMAKKDPSERAVASKKAPSSTYTELSDGDDDDGDQMATILEEDDEEFRVAESPKEKDRGRKPGSDKSKVTTTTTRKSGTAQNKPADNGKNSSPEKKVRRTRASPFNKKSSSVLGANVLSSAAAGSGKEGYGGASSSARSMEAVEEIIVAPRNRSMRENRRRAVYIESDSDSAGEGEPTDDTDFVEDDD